MAIAAAAPLLVAAAVVVDKQLVADLNLVRQFAVPLLPVYALVQELPAAYVLHARHVPNYGLCCRLKTPIFLLSERTMYGNFRTRLHA